MTGNYEIMHSGDSLTQLTLMVLGFLCDRNVIRDSNDIIEVLVHVFAWVDCFSRKHIIGLQCYLL